MTDLLNMYYHPRVSKNPMNYCFIPKKLKLKDRE